MIYSNPCSRCLPLGIKKPHEAYMISRYKGIKLRCLKCGHLKQRYTKEKLKEWKEPQTINTTKPSELVTPGMVSIINSGVDSSKSKERNNE